MSQALNISVVVPVYNEAECLRDLYDQIREALTIYAGESEIIFVDDGSRDDSPTILQELASADQRVRVIFFDRNQGQHKALQIGLTEASNDIIISLDADLQNDPQDIPLLIDKLQQGYDLVCGWRWQRQDPWPIVFKSRLGNFLQQRITGVPLHDMSCTLRAYRKPVLKGLVLRDRYEIGLIPFFISQRTDKITEIKVRHHPRAAGKSKYSFSGTFFKCTYNYLKCIRRRRDNQAG